MTDRPLSGIRVLDFTRVLAGPHATRMLLDLGAEVVKLEPPEGDITRTTWPRVNSISSYFAQQNAGKRCISIHLDSEEGRALVLRLVDLADVVVENFRPGVMDRQGLGWVVLRARNPRLILASVSGYGQTGPWVHRRAYAPVVGAESGFTKAQGDARQGHSGSEPAARGQYANDPHSHADVYTALECGAAILAALGELGQGLFEHMAVANRLRLQLSAHGLDRRHRLLPGILVVRLDAQDPGNHILRLLRQFGIHLGVGMQQLRIVDPEFVFQFRLIGEDQFFTLLVGHFVSTRLSSR